MGRQRKLYAPYRSLGLVCDGAQGSSCAPILHRQGTASFLTAPVDGARTLHLYDTDLHLKGVSKPMPRQWTADADEPRISAIAAIYESTFVAVGAKIGVFLRLKPHTFWVAHDEPISFMQIVGDILISVSEKDGRLVVWRLPPSPRDEPLKKGVVITDIILPPKFVPTCIAHPQTYVNKVLLGSKDGRCLLLNIRSKSVICQFKGFASRITVLEPSPALDVVAVGTENGLVHLHNFRMDETIVAFRPYSEDDDTKITKSQRAISTISFRSDGNQSMVVGDRAGNLIVWDLIEKRVRSEVHGVHLGGAALSQFLAGEPILITAGYGDNSVKVHIFDDANGNARILRSREGHYLPPTLVRFCGYDGTMMVSAGLDRELRLVSIVQESRNRSFAQPKVETRGPRSKKRRRAESHVEAGDQRADLSKKLSPIVALASSNLRQRDHDFSNIVTVHADTIEAYTWRLRNGAMHQSVLAPPVGPRKHALTFKKGSQKKRKGFTDHDMVAEDRCATSVVISPCGNYAVVASKDGRIHSYNLQSGLHQGVYNDASILTQNGAEDTQNNGMGVWGRAHDCPIVDLTVDGCGDILVSGGAKDRLLKFWVFHTRELKDSVVEVPSIITQMKWCRTSDLLAVASENFSIYVYDASTRKLARHFTGHTGPIADLCFDPQGRRIISASMDSTIKTWDLPSGRTLDTLVCLDTPTSVAVAPSGEYLASTHVNRLGISLWIDKSKYQPLQLSGKTSSEIKDGLGSNILDDFSDDEDDTEDGSDDDSEGSSITEDEAKDRESGDGVPLPLSSHIATLSSKPLTDWTTLSNLQAIKERNKPSEGPKKPKDAPFFLPTVKGIHMEFDVEDAEEEEKIKQTGHGKIHNPGKPLNDDDYWINSQFGRLVAREQYEDARLLLSKIGASGVDMELRSLEGSRARKNAAIYFKERLRSPQEFEITQAHLAVFLAAHGTSLAMDEGGVDLIRELNASQQDAWQDLRTKFESVITLSAHFSGQV